MLIGPRITENDVVGGTQVQFERFVQDLRHRASVEVTVISTARPLANRGRLGKACLDARVFLRTLARTWRHAAASDLVLWYVSSRAAILSGAFLWLVCALRRRPLCIGFFGGNFDARLASAPAILRFIASCTYLRADLLLCETRRLTASLGASSRSAWLPTTRDMPRRREPYRTSCRRLLFLSLLDPEKGLPDLMEAALRFPPAVQLSVFGPQMPGFDVRDIDRVPNAAYRGVAAPEDVPAVMEAHDALVLPTRYSSEGYPGVVIEAFQMGLPVIVARRPPLQELVTDGKDGLCVPVGSADSLVEAVSRLCSNDRLFQCLRRGALETGERYRSKRAAGLIEDLCRRAAGRAPHAGERPHRTSLVDDTAARARYHGP